MNQEEYSQLLTHPLWEAKRQEVFVKYGKQCSECASVKHVEVHHKTYSQGKLPWEYPLENFLVLCEKCHGKHHKYEYIVNNCKGCGKEISVKYNYCLPCHNQLIENKEKEKNELEKKINELEKTLKAQKNNTKSNTKVNAKELEKEINRLGKEKNSLEKILLKLKKLDGEFKDEMRANTERLVSKVDELVRSKEVEKNELKSRVDNLESILKKEDRVSTKGNGILQSKKQESAIEKSQTQPATKTTAKVILIVFAAIAAGIIWFLDFTENPLPGKKDQTRAPIQQNSKIDKHKGLPSDNTDSENSRLVKDLDIVGQSAEMSTGKDLASAPRDTKNIGAGNTSRSETAFRTAESNYRAISINEVAHNIGNKVLMTETISQVAYAKNGNIYLNIGGRFPRQKLRLVIFKNNVNNFGDLSKYEFKRLYIKGTVSEYQGKAQIIINHKWQLEEPNK